MELAKQLVRSVARAFYETKLILVVDALIIHSALRDDDMAYLMGMNTKELHKLCGTLEQARLLARHTRSETKEGQSRPISRTYYFIDYRATIDAIKWRVYCIDKSVQGTTVPTDERKEYFCARCKSEWTQMQVLDNVGPEGFVCHRCGFLLTHDADSNKGGHEQSTRLNAQFKFITDLLPKIDQVAIPDNKFEAALAAALPVQRDQVLNPASVTSATAETFKPTAVKGLKDTGPKSVSVNITSGDGPTAAEKAAEQARKDAYAVQNAMPAHFTHSTVTGEAIRPDSAPTIKAQPTDDKKDVMIGTDAAESGAEIDDFFAQLKKQQAEEALKEEAEEFETDDSEDEFEEVVPGGSQGSKVGTPASSNNVASPNANGSGLASALKRGSQPGSGTSSNINSPSGSLGEDGRAAKKVRIEEPEKATITVKEEEESEEDMEFEDV